MIMFENGRNRTKIFSFSFPIFLSLLLLIFQYHYHFRLDLKIKKKLRNDFQKLKIIIFIFIPSMCYLSFDVSDNKELSGGHLPAARHACVCSHAWLRRCVVLRRHEAQGTDAPAQQNHQNSGNNCMRRPYNQYVFCQS